MIVSEPGSKTILVVEDDDSILFALSTLLEGEGYNVQTAQNGLEALESLKRHHRPHLILLDMIMPIMDGWQFTVEYRKTFQYQSPIVVMTAAADAEQRARDIGAVEWIGKPFALDDFLSVIARCLRMQRD